MGRLPGGAGGALHHAPRRGGGIRQPAGGGPARDVLAYPGTNALNASKALSATRTAAMADELDEEQELNLFLAWMEAMAR